MKSQSATKRVSVRPQVATPAFDVLEQVAWNFPNRTRHTDIEAIHPYPAKFIPELPGTVLDLLSIEHGTAVLDPFVGSGTTLVNLKSAEFPQSESI